MDHVHEVQLTGTPTQVNQDTPGRTVRHQARDRGAETAGTRRGAVPIAPQHGAQTPFRSYCLHPTTWRAHWPQPVGVPLPAATVHTLSAAGAGRRARRRLLIRISVHLVCPVPSSIPHSHVH